MTKAVDSSVTLKKGENVTDKNGRRWGDHLLFRLGESRGRAPINNYADAVGASWTVPGTLGRATALAVGGGGAAASGSRCRGVRQGPQPRRPQAVALTLPARAGHESSSP